MWKFSSHVPGSAKRFTCNRARSSSDRSDEEGIVEGSRTVALEDAEDLVTYSHGDVSTH